MKIKSLGGYFDLDKNTIKVPIFTEQVQVGWPSPADDYVERSIDLNEFLISNPAATYLVRASGDSMLNAGINNGAVLIVDRSIEPQHGKIVIASVDGAYTCKKLQLFPEPKLLSAAWCVKLPSGPKNAILSGNSIFLAAANISWKIGFIDETFILPSLN